MKRAVSIALLLVGVCGNRGGAIVGGIRCASDVCRRNIRCSSEADKGNADGELRNDRKPSTLRIALRDRRTGVECGYQAQSRIYTRSVIKVALSRSPDPHASQTKVGR